MRRPISRPRDAARGSLRGSPHLRLRFGFLVIAMVLSVFGARLVQLQGVDPNAYAAMAAAEGTVTLDLPAERGDILDRNGRPLADSIDGEMVVADPAFTRDKAPELAKFLASRLDIDYFETLKALRLKGKRFSYIARRVPASKAESVVAAAEDAGYKGLDTRHDPVRDYPAGDIAANLVGFMGTDEALAGFESNFDKQLAGTDGSERYSVGVGNRIPLGHATIKPPVDGQDLRTTIDLDLQWYVQRVLRQTVEDARADSGFAVVMDTKTGEVLALADHPTFDARTPQAAPAKDRVSRAMTDVYEPGSVEKVLTLSALIDAGKATDRTRVTIPPSLQSGDRVIHDWFSHGILHFTLAGVIAQSSNIGTVLASRHFETGQLRDYLTRFGLGQKTNVGVAGETQGILPDPSIWTSMTQDRIAFGQSLSVNALQMAAAVNTVANGGVRVSPSLIRGTAVTDDRLTVGTDTTTTQRIISKSAAHQMALMMERVVDPDAGVAPAAQVPGYRVAGKTGTAQRVGPICGCYNDTFTVSFAGFAPADKPRFTVYVVVQVPRNGGGGGSVAGPAFSKIMSYALRRYGVPPTGTAPSQLPDDVEARASSLAQMSEELSVPLGQGPRASRPQHPPQRPLTELAAWLAAADPSAEAHGDLGGVATGVSLASQRVLPGDVYAALPGNRAHGVAYAAEAVTAGAVAVLTDRHGAEWLARAPAGVPVLEVGSPRALLGRFAAHVYGEPARSLRMLGVTGTQGKTTTTRLADSALQQAGVRSAVVGTVGTRVDGEEIKTALTTPEAPDLHGLFAMMKERAVAACAMEVSSHALVLGRVDGVVFDVAVFTNLGRDHLDFHADVEDYFEAKASLFTAERCRRALVNIDDEHGRRLLGSAGDRGVPTHSFSVTDRDADWRAEDVEVTAGGSRFVVAGPDGVRVEAGCPLPGDFNVANALAALAGCALLGFDLEAVARAMAEGGGVPGRLERVDAGQDFTVVVDYAHKPDAVTAALEALRPLTQGRLIVVLGAGGERDHGKRPIMGEIAARLADVLVVTDDNPRGEDPAAIRAQILDGTRDGTAEVVEVGDRRDAIREAVGRARRGDVVLVAGKGHETGQEVAGVVLPFDDREVVRAALEAQG